MARERIGLCPCPTCRHDVPVRKNSKGKLYLFCGAREGHPGCGMHHLNLPGGQEYILNNARMDPPGGADDEPPPAPAPAPAPEPAPPRRRRLSDLLSLDDFI